MEEHRFACPTHVREFTRFRAHADFSGDDSGAVPALDDGPPQATAPAGEEGRAAAASGPPRAR